MASMHEHNSKEDKEDYAEIILVLLMVVVMMMTFCLARPTVNKR
jgi:hypothetical protein